MVNQASQRTGDYMEALSLTAVPTRTKRLINQITADAGVDLKDCYQCGKCSAGCPVAPMASMMPREVIRNLQLGNAESVIDADMPWLCASCGMCQARCPQNVDLPNLMLACRRAALREGKKPLQEVSAFNSIFIDGVKEKGVSDEAALAMKFNVVTGHLAQDALSAPKMVLRGMLNLSEHKVDGASEVKAIIERSRLAEENICKPETVTGGAQ